MNLLTKQKEIHRQKTNSYLPKGRESQGFREGPAILLYLKWITNKNLFYSTLNSAQYYVPG